MSFLRQSSKDLSVRSYEEDRGRLQYPFADFWAETVYLSKYFSNKPFFKNVLRKKQSRPLIYYLAYLILQWEHIGLFYVNLLYYWADRRNRFNFVFPKIHRDARKGFQLAV